jgi:hypothetical protein
VRRWFFGVLAMACAALLSCNVNEYCLNCAVGGDAVTGDAGDGDANDGGSDDDAGDAGPCVPTGIEVCDGKDNDCDGAIDEGQLPEVGEQCANQVGECAGAVKQCVAGTIRCSRVPEPEQCDGKDNDCNGLTDEGDPGGGAKCGTDVGECVAGVLRCNTATATIECVGAIGGIAPPFGSPEICDGRDNDCDGQFDEGIGALGSCGGGPGPDPNAGMCQQGTLMCVGGGTVCVGSVGPTFEACDTLDNDCDGQVDEETNKLTDPRNCGSCGFVCNLPNAIEGCAGGQCTIAACVAQFHDNNGITADGCEFGPCTIQGNEVCNGIDDDCNPATDEANLPPPPNLCLAQGECAGATASCQGANGFRCSYAGTVSTDANGNVVQETACDGLDNDCDGLIDEGQPNLGQECTDNGVGVCRGTGTFQCNPADPNGPAICVITNPGGSPSPEACDGLDNDCDGVVDNGAGTGNLIGQEWVTIPGTSNTQIMKYEASRPDASAAGGGTNQTFACSKPGVLPWTNLTHPQAEAACASIGARLCTELEWQKMCDPAPSYPIAGPGTTGFVVVEAESASGIAAGAGGAAGIAWTFQQPPIQLQDFSGIGAMQALPNSSNIQISRANAPSQSPRLDFQLSLNASTQYFVWVRMMGINNSSDRVYVGLSQNPTGAGAADAGSGTSGLETNPDNVWVWVRSNAMSTGAAGTYTASVYMGENGVRVDAIAITRDASTTPPAFDERTWAYQANPKIPQPQACNGDDFDTNPALPGDQDDILATGSLPQCFANGPGVNDAFDMSGNVKEWVARRAPGQNPLRGGASNNELDGLTCGLNFTLANDQFFFPNVGFRCCRN